MKWRQSSSAKGDASREEFILTKEHPRIDEFLDGLAGRRGLDLRKHCDLDAAHFGRCNGDARRPLVKSILSRMGIQQFTDQTIGEVLRCVRTDLRLRRLRGHPKCRRRVRNAGRRVSAAGGHGACRRLFSVQVLHLNPQPVSFRSCDVTACRATLLSPSSPPQSLR